MEHVTHAPLASGDPGPVTALLVPERERLNFLPRHFGPLAVVVESAIYITMDHLCPSYEGGYWDFYELSNGGALLAPTGAPQFFLACDGNGHACHLPPLATGIAVCAMAYNHLAFRHHGPLFAEMYYRVRDFLVLQPEAGALWALLD